MLATDEQEEWRSVVGHEERYEVSSFGRVRRGGRVLKPQLNRKGKRGYLRVELCCGQGRGRPHYIHCLVAAAFLGPCPVGMEVNHRDSNRTNARLSNLEYLTPSGNNLHAIAAGRWDDTKLGEAHSCARLNTAAVLAIRASALNGGQLARQYNVSSSTIYRIKARQSWKHVGEVVQG